MKENPIRDKSFSFGVCIVKLVQYLQTEKKKFILSKQLLRSGTSIGAMAREAEHAESKLDFIHKLAIAQKEKNETIYWLELLNATKLIESDQFNEVHVKAVELIKMVTSIIKSTKLNLKK